MLRLSPRLLKVGNFGTVTQMSLQLRRHAWQHHFSDATAGTYGETRLDEAQKHATFFPSVGYPYKRAGLEKLIGEPSDPSGFASLGNTQTWLPLWNLSRCLTL